MYVVGVTLPTSYFWMTRFTEAVTLYPVLLQCYCLTYSTHMHFKKHNKLLSSADNVFDFELLMTNPCTVSAGFVTSPESAPPYSTCKNVAGKGMIVVSVLTCPQKASQPN